MRRTLPLLVLTAAAASAADLPPGTRLPALKGEYLSGRNATLPDDAAGRVSLLALGFTYESRFAVEAWVKKFRTEFGESPQAGFYEIPMIGGMARMGKWFIDSGMRRATPKGDHEHVITVYGGTGPWKDRLGFKAPNGAYLILLDKTGVVRWRHSGPFDEAAYKALAAETKAQLSKPAQ